MYIKHTFKYWRYEMRDDEWRDMWDDCDTVTMIIYAYEVRWKTWEQAGCL